MSKGKPYRRLSHAEEVTDNGFPKQLSESYAKARRYDSYVDIQVGHDIAARGIAGKTRGGRVTKVNLVTRTVKVKAVFSRNKKGLSDLMRGIYCFYFVVYFYWVPTGRADRELTEEDVAEREAEVTAALKADGIRREEVHVIFCRVDSAWNHPEDIRYSIIKIHEEEEISFDDIIGQIGEASGGDVDIVAPVPMQVALLERSLEQLKIYSGRWQLFLQNPSEDEVLWDAKVWRDARKQIEEEKEDAKKAGEDAASIAYTTDVPTSIPRFGGFDVESLFKPSASSISAIASFSPLLIPQSGGTVQPPQILADETHVDDQATAGAGVTTTVQPNQWSIKRRRALSKLADSPSNAKAKKPRLIDTMDESYLPTSIAAEVTQSDGADVYEQKSTTAGFMAKVQPRKPAVLTTQRDLVLPLNEPDNLKAADVVEAPAMPLEHKENLDVELNREVSRPTPTMYSKKQIVNSPKRSHVPNESSPAVLSQYKLQSSPTKSTSDATKDYNGTDGLKEGKKSKRRRQKGQNLD